MPHSRALFISDLHLDAKRPELLAALGAFCKNIASQADALYVLGDLFEAWIGDDDDAPLVGETIACFAQLQASGTDLFFMRGNRDFLLGSAFAERCGGTLLEDDEALIHCAHHGAVLLHGDTLCTDDKEYQAFRAHIRAPQSQQQLLSKPLPERRAIAKQLREKSGESMSNKAADIMDVNAAAVAEAFQRNGVELMIHGHTHRPAIHALGNDCKRVVLGDWHSEYQYAELDQSGIELHKVIL